MLKKAFEICTSDDWSHKSWVLKELTCLKVKSYSKSNHYIFCSRHDLSKPVHLEAGLYYYIEALHASTGDKIDDFQIGFVAPSGKTQFPIKKDILLQFNPSKFICTINF